VSEAQAGPVRHSSARLARSSALMASGTLVSRVMGLVRTALLVGIVGTGLSGDAWDTANTLPNTIYILLAGGILNVVFVPQITRALAQEDKGRDFTDRLITLALASLLATTVLVTAGAYAVTKLYAWSWSGEQLGLAVAFAYLCLPQVFFYGLYAVLGQVLNAQEKFGWYMWAPVANNIVAISGLALFAVLYPGTDLFDPGDWTAPMVLLMGGTATLGVVVQAAVLLPVVWLSGFRWRPRWGFRGVGLGSASRMAMWTLAIIGLSQAGLLLSTNVLNWNAAANPGVPGKIVYSTAFLIFILPHSLVATSLLTAMFPQLSRAAMNDDRAALGEQYTHGLRLLGVAMVPVSVAVLVLAPQLSASLLVFTGQGATDDIAWVVRALTLGLVPYGMYLLSQRVFHAYQEGRPPFRLQLVITGIAVASLVVAVLLPPQVTAMAIGAGQSLGQAVAAVLGIWWVRRRLGGLPVRDVGSSYLRAGAAALIPVLPLLGVVAVGEQVFDGRLASLSVLVSGGVAYFLLYGVLAHLFGVRELSEVLDPLLRRVRRRRPGRGPEGGGPDSGGPDSGGPDSGGPDSGGPDGGDPSSRGGPGAETPRGGPRGDGAGSTGARLLWDPSPTGQREEPMVHGIDTGTVLGGRYELEELLARRDDTLDYWSATDQTLDRLVAVTVLPATGAYEDMAHAVLDGARRTAGVDDPRLVRVLDVGLEQEVCWIVEEGLSEAESLASLVLEHPLPAEEARRIVGEAASGLESARRRGLHHLYLNPHAVLRTSEGSVKVSGVGVAAAIEQVDDVSAAEASLIDTTDLLSLLYTGLTGRWPGEDIEGLRPARRLADGTLPAPSEVVAGVPGDLDALCRITFGAEYSPDRGPRTPGELARQLAPWPSEVVPGAGGAARGPDAPLEDAGAAAALAAGAGAGAAVVTSAAGHDEHAPQETTDAGDDQSTTEAEDTAAGDEPHYYRTRDDVGLEDERGGDMFVPAAAGAAGAAGATGAATAATPVAQGATGTSAAPLASAEVDRPAERRQSGLVLALVAGILAVAVFLAYGAFQGLGSDEDPVADPGTTSSPTDEEQDEGAAADPEDSSEETSAPEEEPEDEDTPAEPIEIAGITSYDPEGDGDERNDIVDAAIDGDSDTAWNSHTYLAPEWGNLKDGVGLLVDLGGSQEVTEVGIEFPQGDYGVEVLVTDEASREGGTSIGALDDASGEETFTAEEPVTGQYVLIWFDRAWAGPEGEIVYVSEVTVQ
jgi:putative peptidoglycan lipid II flippase